MVGTFLVGPGCDLRPCARRRVARRLRASSLTPATSFGRSARTPKELNVANQYSGVVLVEAFVGDNDPNFERQSEFQRKMQDAGIRYDKYVDDFVSWVDKEERQFTGNTDGGGGGGKDNGDGGGGDSGGGGEGGRRPISLLPWITAWGALLHLSYVVGEWKGYGHFSTLELLTGLGFAWGMLWTAVELFKIRPNTNGVEFFFVL
mmetsp:Transcript_43467/g.81408  ORF Transcript_43467/g.81408 Transcript_43467/m.81408 type:complete len:204 (+) Transcript_43467:411-1022(+)